MSRDTQIMPRRELVTVTTMRGLAALAVCWFHIALWNKHLPDWSFSFGIHGPLVFFIISGFVVPWALWKADYRWRAALRFFAKRLARLEPPYFATIALILCLDFLRSRLGLQTDDFSIDWYRLAVHVGYLNAFVGEVWYNPVFWTLAVEFQYYLLIALAFPLLCTRDWRIRSLLTLGLLATYLPLHGVEESPWVFRCLPVFMNGFLLFQRRAGIIGAREFWLWSSILIALSIGFSPLMPLLALLTVWLLLQDRFHTAATGFLGQISYSLYLVHAPLGKPFQDILLTHATTDTQRIAIALATTAFCILAAWGFYRLIERPSMLLSKRIRYRARPREANAHSIPSGAPPQPDLSSSS